MTRISFQALEYQADTTFREARYSFEGSTESGWSVTRDGRAHLELGPGYRLLRTRECGVCSTDLARHFLPFPLPQVTGHELVALDEHGQRFVVEINASHRARGLESDCAFCAGGLPTHCPERLVLGIHDLPGGFGPWILAPVEAALPVAAEIPTSSAVLVEPFAAALQAVTTLFPLDRERDAVQRVAVLGPRRLGMLVVAALAGWRARHGFRFEILALARHASLLRLAREFGATETRLVEGAGDALPNGLADVVIDTTGSPAGLALAIRLAEYEVHLKSTHGQPAVGLRHLTELVVDELALASAAPLLAGAAPFARPSDGSRPRVVWLLERPAPAGLAARVELLEAREAATALTKLEADYEPGHEPGHPSLPRADAAVVGNPSQADSAIRPREGLETSLVRPRGEVLIHPEADVADSPLLEAVVRRGLRLSSSRCGDFRLALDLMAGDPELVALGRKLVTHRFESDRLQHAFAVAREPECIKAVVEFPMR